MKKLFILALGFGFLASSVVAHAASCGGEPWSASNFLAGKCSGAGDNQKPGDNTEGLLQVAPQFQVKTDKDEDKDNGGDNGEGPGSGDPVDHGGDNGGEGPGSGGPSGPGGGAEGEPQAL